MNYIKKLERETSLMVLEQLAVSAAIRDFRLHLTSAKFATDTTIQTGDVENRLLAMLSEVPNTARNAGEWLMDNAQVVMDTLPGRYPEEEEARHQLFSHLLRGEWAYVRGDLRQLSRTQVHQLTDDVREQLAVIGIEVPA